MASFVETHGHAADEGNFEALYTTYKSDVQRLASYLLKNATDAEDAAQTVFLNVLRALRQGVTPADPRAWLLAITRNVCFSRHRAAAARPVQVELDYDEPAGPSGDETPSADEIVGALARMLPNQRTALILRDFRGVSRAEICDLMELTPVAVEALLTRARTAFREELEAGDQPFECAETRALVEQQLDGLITVADRHSLRSHLRHCAPCSTLARAVRSSRSKVAGILFWPVDLISRLTAAFSQAPSVVHAAAAVTSAAAVATIAIPAAVSNGPQLGHVEGRTASEPAVAAIIARPAAAARPQAVARGASRTGQPAAAQTVSSHRAAKAPPHRGVHTRPATHPAGQTTASAPASTAASAPVARTTVHARPAPSTGGVHTAPQTTSSSSSSALQGSGHGITMPGTSSPRSSWSSPAVKPSAKPKPKARPMPKKPSRNRGKRGGRDPRVPGPPNQAPPSTPPAAGLPPSGGGAPDAGSGATAGGDQSQAGTQQSRSSAQGSTDSGSPSTVTSRTGASAGDGTGDDNGKGNGTRGGSGDGDGDGNGNGNGNGDKHKPKGK